VRSRAVKIAAVLLSLLILSFGLVASNAHAQAPVTNQYPEWFDDEEYDGTHYFLHTDVHGEQYYLRPVPPNITATNEERRAKVENTGKIYFPFAREDWSQLIDLYWDDPAYTPRISVVVNSGKTVGKILNFEIWFDFDGLAGKESDVDAKAVFAPYTTMKKDDTETVDLTATKITGEMRDFDNSTDNVGNIKLVIWRTDDKDDTMFIYCGAYRSYSWMIVPFKFYRPPPDYNFTEEDDNTVRFAAFLIVVGLLGIAAVIYYIYWSRKQKAEKDDDDSKEESKSKREQNRKRRDKQRQKTKRFYRKNR
jgi:hypothetical protein